MTRQIDPASAAVIFRIFLAVLTMSPLGFGQEQSMPGMSMPNTPSPATTTPSQAQATSHYPKRTRQVQASPDCLTDFEGGMYLHVAALP